MNIKAILVSILVLLSFGSSLAQSDQELQAELQYCAQMAKNNYATYQSALSIFQMAGDSQNYQLTQYEIGYTQQYWNYLEQVANNPNTLRNPQGLHQFRMSAMEYAYRTKFRDYRPYEQIAGNFQQWVAQRQWEVSTPEGQASYNAQRQMAQQNFEANQARHAQANATFDNYMNSLKDASNQQYKDHQQYVNTIHDRYEYVNPYDGQGYMYPNTQSGNPVMQNPDGSYSELVPYQRW